MTTHRLSRAIALGVMLAFAMPGGALAAAPQAVDDAETVAEDASATTINVLTNDTDDDMDTLTIVGASDPAHGTVQVTGGGSSVTYEPDANYHGDDSFSYTISDGTDEDTGGVDVTVISVNDEPSAVTDNKTMNEDAGATPMNVLTNDDDVDGDDLSILLVGAASHGVTAITGDGANLTYRPNGNYFGTDSFTYTISDGIDEDTATVDVTVNGVDDPPVAVDDEADVAEDVTTPIDVLDNDTDIDTGPMKVVAKSNGDHGDVTITGDGTGITYHPDLNYVGDDMFTYELNGGSEATVTVTVGATDDLPSAEDDEFTILEDATIQTFDVLDNDTDFDGGPMTATSVTDPPKGTASLTPGGSGVRYVPTANANGEDEFDYTLNGGSTATVSVIITPVDDAPVAVIDSFTVAEDPPAPVPLDVRLNDTDIDGGLKTIVDVTNASKGLVVIVGSGSSLTYMPNANAIGADTFAYTLNGGSVGTVGIEITPSNDPPVAGPDSLSLPAGAAAVPVPVLANDTDVDGDALTIAGATAPAKGTVVVGIGGASLTYRPYPGLFGPDSFTYTVADGHGGTAIGTVNVTITSDNHAPSAVNDAKSVPQGAGPTLLTILANDQDLDGNTLTITAKTNGAHGAVVITGGGTGLTYNPVNSFDGIDTFTYTISDGLASDSATVRVTVVHDTAPPIVMAPLARFPGQTVGGSTTKARLTWGASDPGSGIKRYKVQVSVDGKAWKTITLPKATSRTIQSSLKTGHTYRFRARATDGEGNTSAYVKGPLLKPVRSSEASTRVTYVGAWAKTRTTKALGGATRHATSSAKRARFTFTGYDVGWIATRTTKSGKARIYVDGALVTTIDLDRARTTYRKLVFARHFATLGPHTLEIQPVGDGRVDIDGFVVLR